MGEVGTERKVGRVFWVGRVWEVREVSKEVVEVEGEGGWVV